MRVNACVWVNSNTHRNYSNHLLVLHNNPSAYPGTNLQPAHPPETPLINSRDRVPSGETQGWLWAADLKLPDSLLTGNGEINQMDHSQKLAPGRDIEGCFEGGPLIVAKHSPASPLKRRGGLGWHQGNRATICSVAQTDRNVALN